MMWSHYILHMIDRTGVGDYIPDCSVFHKVFHRKSDDEKSLVKLNIVGAFQTAAQKAKWSPTVVNFVVNQTRENADYFTARCLMK